MVWELLGKYDVNIRGMERFGARKETALDTCIAEVEQSDIYIGIIGYKLGSIEKKSSKSYTQIEYEKALELDRDILIYLIDEKNSKISPQNIDFGEKYEKLQSFKYILKDRHTIDTFIDETDLTEKLTRKFDELLSKKQTADKSTDEFQNAKIIVDRFLLVPKAFSGKEIKLKVKFNSEPFPASKAICSSFSLEYGKTIGVKIDIINPMIKVNSLEYLFIDYNKLDEFWEIQKDMEVEIYAQLQFSEEHISNQKANFVEKTYSYIDASVMPSSGSIGYSGLSGFSGYTGYSGMKTETIKAEGHIILKLTKIIKQ
jgi:hypothetical protein